MHLYECKIGTLVTQKGYPKFVGHISGMEWNGLETIPVVTWPVPEPFRMDALKSEYKLVPWIQLDLRTQAIHQDNLEPY